MRQIPIEAMSEEAFRPFGDLLSASGAPDRIINQGLCGRFHDRARLDFGGGRAGVSLFDAVPRELPLTLAMVERHPLGSQCFVPMLLQGFLVIVTEAPEAVPRAFRTEPGQAVNFLRGTWHGVLMPLHAPGLFAVIDRIGDEPNLEEHWYAEPWRVG